MTEYEQLAPESRAWIFQSDREFNDAESKSINEALAAFVENWLSHGSQLKATYKVIHNRFIIFFADEEGDRMCGRAVDASVRFIKTLETKYGLSLLERNRVAYLKNDKVQSCTLNQMGQRIDEGEIFPETIIFNNLVSTKAEFEQSWTVPLAKSWHRSYVMQNQ